MKAREEGKTAIKFPMQKYFRQIFSNSTCVTIVNPFEFWRIYKIEHLESCYQYDLVRFLERCRRKKKQPAKSNQENNSIWSRENRGLPSNQQDQNVNLISQPNYELKYRGVSYRSNSTYIFNQTGVEIKLDWQSLIQPEILPINSDNKDNSKTSNGI